jgi:hypothetical protein
MAIVPYQSAEGVVFPILLQNWEFSKKFSYCVPGRCFSDFNHCNGSDDSPISFIGARTVSANH